MNFKAWFKSKTADKALSPIRDIVIGLIDPGSNLLEVGCGTGDLLYRASGKISEGLGVDLDQSMVDFANARKKRDKTQNISFINANIITSAILSGKIFDVSTSTLCLHEMGENEAISTLIAMSQHSSKIIIADFSKPNTSWDKISIELDEFISGHYGMFKHYQKCGGTPYLSDLAGLEIISETKSPIDGINVWLFRGKNHA